MRQGATDLTKRRIDACAAMAGSLMKLWMAQDGFDDSFQAEDRRMWDDPVAALAEVAKHHSIIDIAVEWKPDEPRDHAVMPDIATTLLALAAAQAGQDAVAALSLVTAALLGA